MQKVAASHWLVCQVSGCTRVGVCVFVLVCISAVITPAGHWKRSAAFYLAEVFKLSADFTENLHGYISLPSPLCLLLSAVCNDIECCLCVCVCRCVDADYFLVYLVTKSRFLFKLKSSLTPALNIIIKRAKKPSQELAPAEATHLLTPTHTHTRREKTHTHLHSYLQSSSIAIEIQSTNSSDTHTPISRFQFESVTKTESELELRFWFWFWCCFLATAINTHIKRTHTRTRTHTHLERAALRVHHTLVAIKM